MKHVELTELRKRLAKKLGEHAKARVLAAKAHKYIEAAEHEHAVNALKTMFDLLKEMEEEYKERINHVGE